MTTCPDCFKKIHLAVCNSTNDYLKQNFASREVDFPLMVSADIQTAGRGRENRGWISPQNLGIYATFGFFLSDKRCLSLLSITSGIAVIDMLERWTGKVFTLKWPNDILADGKKIAGILCETIINGDKIICLVGVGINLNHGPDDFPPELRTRAASLRLQTGREWSAADGRERLAASMASWLGKLFDDRRSSIIERARYLSRSFQGQEIAFHHQGRIIRGVFLDIADDGGLLLNLPGAGEKIFYSGELD